MVTFTILGSLFIMAIGTLCSIMLLGYTDPWLAQWHSFVTGTALADACVATPDAPGCTDFRVWRLPGLIAFVGVLLAALIHGWP